ncbi:MAG: ABC transporter permease, partial [Pseudomonadota bacterium]
MIRACLQALLSYWRRNPLQLFAILAGLALATALWSGVQAINAEARASYDAAAATLGEGQYDQLVPREGTNIAQSVYVELRRAGWLVSPVIDDRLGDVRVVGIDPLTSPSGLSAGEMVEATEARSLAANAPLYANAETARQLEGLAEVQIDAGIAPRVAIGDVGVVQRLLKRDDLSRLIVLPEQPIGQPELASVAPDLRLQQSQQTADVAQLTESF